MDEILLKELEGLSAEQKELALKMLSEYTETGLSDTYSKLLYSDYDEIPVDIHTFLHDRKYLGNALYDLEGKFTLFPYWEKKLEEIFPTNTTTVFNTIILTGAIGLGKAQPLDSLVLTTTGYKLMGSLTLNDRVFGVDGKPHNILGIFPLGKKNICKVTFTDNTSTLCCDEHLWTVYNTKNLVWTTVETKDLMNSNRNLKHAAGHRYKIPMVQPVEFEHKDLYIDPYILGVLLGDGNIIDSVKFSSNDLEIVDEIKRSVSSDYEVRKVKAKISYSICKIKQTTQYDENRHTQIPTKNLYYELLENYKLNVKTNYKYIPKDYLFNDINSRIALLQGLMDTDGYISKDGSLIEFTTISELLKDDFVFLVLSLGGICHVRTKIPSYKNKITGEKIYCNKSYNIGIKLPSTICPFRLSRKVERLSNRSLEPFRYIKSIELLNELLECQCIYIDSKEHLYLTNDFIVTHNTMIACVCLLYLLYRLLCLKDPYLFYGMLPIDKISISLMNITLENAKGVALDKMNQMILSSEWFMSHGEMGGTTNLTFRPDKHIELITASSNNQVIGRALFANFTDEVNFGLTSDVEKLKKKQKQLISQIDARMKSRFMRGTYLPTLNIIASSKNSDQSFLDDYINNKKKNESTTTLIVDEPQWVVDSRKDSDVHFYVAVGNKFLANELLPKDAPEILVDEYRAKGYLMLSVPEGYYENFQDNIDGALTDIAGIATASSLKYISGVRWNEIKVETYENPFIKEIIEVGTGADDFTLYFDFFDLSKVKPELMAKPLYIHLDMSKSGDKTGIAGNYVIGKKPKVDGQDVSRELFYQVAFNVSIKAPKGREISFDKNRAFIRWLRDLGFNIKGISCFKGDTLISTPNGLKMIKDILVGDEVFAYDDDEKLVKVETVYNTVNNGPRTDFIKVWIDNDTYIECTPEHKIKTQRGYVMARDLTEYDLIEVDDATYYKNKLLNTSFFIDNEHLTSYIELILKNRLLNNNDIYTELHHIFPKSLSKILDLNINNSELNICSLSYGDHVLAHCLLTKCTIEPYRSKTIAAVNCMKMHLNILSEVTLNDYITNSNLLALVNECKLGRKHTADEIYKISQSNKKPHNVHPKTEFLSGLLPWNTGISWYEIYDAATIKKKFSHNNKYTWINNSIDEEKLILATEDLPDNYSYGRLPCTTETKSLISKTCKERGIKPSVLSGYKNYTNGIINKKIYPGDTIPDGFYPGRTIDTTKSRARNFFNSDIFRLIQKDEYYNFYMTHSRAETLVHFNVSLANHKKICKYYNIKKRT